MGSQVKGRIYKLTDTQIETLLSECEDKEEVELFNQKASDKILYEVGIKDDVTKKLIAMGQVTMKSLSMPDEVVVYFAGTEESKMNGKYASMVRTVTKWCRKNGYRLAHLRVPYNAELANDIVDALGFESEALRQWWVEYWKLLQLKNSNSDTY